MVTIARHVKPPFYDVLFLVFLTLLVVFLPLGDKTSFSRIRNAVKTSNCMQYSEKSWREAFQQW